MHTDPATSRDSLKAAMAALMRGDTAERDRLCRRAEVLLNAEAKSRALAMVMAVDFMVDSKGTAYRTRDLLRVAL